MQKRICSLCIVFAVLITMLAGCKETVEKTQDRPVKLWYAYNTENLMQDMEYPELMAQRDATVRFSCIRNDVESAQLMITPEQDIASYDFTMGDLKNAEGDVLSADHFEVFAQWYTEITQSYNNKVDYGFYPDALIPWAAYVEKGYSTIKAGQNQALWLHANIPVDQKAGVYTGEGTLVLDGKTYQIPVEVTVYDATMPQENHVKTQFAIWFDLVDEGEGYYSEELGEAYYDFLVSKRIMPTKAPDPIWSVHHLEEFVDWSTEKAADPMVSAYSLPYAAETLEDGTKLVSRTRVMEVLSALAQKNIELREAGDLEIDLFSKAVYYLGSICDEPSGERMITTKQCDLIITQCKAEVADQYFKDQYPDLYDSCMSVPHIVTSAYNDQMIGSDTEGGVQTWCGQFHTWHSEAQRENYYNRRENSEREYGEGLWWYGCESPRVPFANFHMDDDGIVTRLVPWMMFDYDVDGMIYWCVNYYQTEDIYVYPSVYLDVNGDGQLLYPGEKFGIFGPLSSRRLESLREGMEDYECLLMIENAILAYNEANGTNHDPKALMASFYEGLYEGLKPQRENSDFFAQRRTEMLKLLAQFTTDPAAAMQTLT